MSKNRLINYVKKLWTIHKHGKERTKDSTAHTRRKKRLSISRAWPITCYYLLLRKIIKHLDNVTKAKFPFGVSTYIYNSLCFVRFFKIYYLIVALRRYLLNCTSDINRGCSYYVLQKIARPHDFNLFQVSWSSPEHFDR